MIKNAQELFDERGTSERQHAKELDIKFRERVAELKNAIKKK